MASPWIGAWEPLLDSFDGRALLTPEHFCGVFARKNRTVQQGDRPTEAEAAALFRSMAGSFAGFMKTTEARDEWFFDMTVAVAALPARVGTHMRRAHRMEGDRMYGEDVQSDGVRAPADVYRRLSEPGISPLAGAWELVSSEWDGLMVTTDTEYRYIVTRKDRPDVSGPVREISDAVAATLYDSFDAQGGSYAVSGSTMTRRPEIARDSGEQSREFSFEIGMVGDMLTFRTAQQELAWLRLEQGA